jgi:hypothetical protein
LSRRYMSLCGASGSSSTQQTTDARLYAASIEKSQIDFCFAGHLIV